MKIRLPKGFTLIELIMVIAITGIIAVSLVIFFTPAVNSYFDTQRRASLVDMADTALRRMRRDVQRAVPNSIRTPNAQCFELVPTSAGGRVRMGPDTGNDPAVGCAPGVNCSAWLDTSTAIKALDVLSPFSTMPAAGDWIVIGNQSANDVYSGASRVQITAVAAGGAFGRHLLKFNDANFSAGYDGGRFSVVSNNGGFPTVYYVCDGADTDINGTGQGILYRVPSAFNAGYPAACPAIAAGASILATRVAGCSFVYSPMTGNTQQNGYVAMQIDLADSGERISLSFGAHVDNVP